MIQTLRSPLDVARSIIDRDIAQLEESIRALKSRRNELSPISSLPPEVLYTIFSFIDDRTSRSFRWINFSQVSRHWRSLALNSPKLWTNLPLCNSRWTQEMLTRSKMAELTIRIDLSYQPKSIFETMKLCLSHMKHIGELNISGISGTRLKEVFQDLPKFAPQLHTLRIARCLGGEAFTIHEYFLCDAERLQCIDLANCEISWDSRLLTSLTRLTLHHSLGEKANSSFIHFLYALQRMPALTHLDLEDSIPHESGGQSVYPAVDLPSLQVLCIWSSVDALTTALHHITFPYSAVLKLTCTETRSTEIDFSNFFSVLATKFLSSLVIRSLCLEDFCSISRQDGVRFRLSTTAFGRDCLPYTLSALQLDLALEWSSPPLSHTLQNYVKVITSALNAMSLPVLTRLAISTSNINSKILIKTFGTLPLLERVYVADVSTQIFLNALVYKMKAADQSKKSAISCVSFPKLRYIHLRSIDFVQTNKGSKSVDMLMDCLMERYERNAAIHELHLDDCYGIWDHEVEKLREVVDVIWDGRQQTLSMTEYDSEEGEDFDSNWDSDF